MPVREVYGSGTEAKTSDTRRILLAKYLTALIAQKGTSNPNNYPSSGDTRELLRIKMLRVRDGI